MKLLHTSTAACTRRLFTLLAAGVTAVTLQVSSQQASAVLLAKESFVYDPGNLNGASGGDGWNGAWTNIGATSLAVSAGGLDYTGLFSEGLLHPDGASAIRGAGVGSSAASTRQHTHAVGGESLWFSILTRVNSTSAVGSALRFYPLATSSVGNASSQVSNGLGFRIDDQGVLQGVLGGNPLSPSSLSITLDETTMIVGRIDLPANLTDPVAIQLWVNPDLGDITTGTGSISYTSPGSLAAAIPTVGSFSDLDRAFVRFGIDWDGEVDEILFGSTGPVVIMPEPTRGLLLGFAGLLLIARRRR